jgi:dipeptidase
MRNPPRAGFFVPTPQTKTYAMDEPTYWWQTTITAALGMMGWLGSRAVKRIDDLQIEVETLKRTAITKVDLKDDLGEHTKTIIDAVNRVSEEVRQVDAKAERANQRLDHLRDEELARLRARNGAN